MADNNKRPILYRGEKYSRPIEKKPTIIPKEPSITFEESRDRLVSDINEISVRIRNAPETKKLPNETIVCVSVKDDYVAKSYYPEAIFGSSNELE